MTSGYKIERNDSGEPVRLWIDPSAIPATSKRTKAAGTSPGAILEQPADNTIQGQISFGIQSQPVPTDPSVAPEHEPRLTRQAEAIFDWLQEGPQTEEHLRTATGSKRVAARIYDLKRWLRWNGCAETVRSHTDARGVCTYRLEAEP